MIKTLLLGLLFLASPIEGEERTFKITFYCSCPRCTGKYSPSFGGVGNTATGHAPIPFRTVAVGDPSLLGKWIYFEDLGGWVLASDTGAKCKSVRTVRRTGFFPTSHSSDRIINPLSGSCVASNQVDVFVGGPSMHKRALEMGVQEWTGKILGEMDPGKVTRRVDE